MRTDSQKDLDYQLPKLIGSKNSRKYLTARAARVWLAEIPALNINQLLYDIPRYLQEINQIEIADKQRFKILELLRPTIAYIFEEIIKSNLAGNLPRTLEFQERQQLANILLEEMAKGYQRLVSNKAFKSLNILNRTHYSVLIERTAYYLAERIRLAYMFRDVIPEELWYQLNLTYIFSQELDLNRFKVKDKFAFKGIKKCSVDEIYRRVILLTMVNPYNLRSAELDQIYYGLSSWLMTIRFVKALATEERSSYVIDFRGDHGPVNYPVIDGSAIVFSVDNRELVKKLTIWLEKDKAPPSVFYKGMSRTLLKKVIHQLDGSIVRTLDRVVDNTQQIDVVIGLQDIYIFLDNLSLFDDNPNVQLEVNDIDLALQGNGLTKEVDVWEKLYYPQLPKQPAARILPPNSQAKRKRQTYKVPVAINHSFSIINESERGICLSCNKQLRSGVFIGKLLLIKKLDCDMWTLSTIRWIMYKNNKLHIGLYLLSDQIEKVLIKQEHNVIGVESNALYLRDAIRSDTILLPSAEYERGQRLYMTQGNDELKIVLTNVIWKSEGLSRFCFNIIASRSEE